MIDRPQMIDSKELMCKCGHTFNRHYRVGSDAFYHCTDCDCIRYREDMHLVRKENHEKK